MNCIENCITEEQAQTVYKNLKKIDEYAKSFGITIYRIDCEFIVGNNAYTLTDRTLNELPQKYSEIFKN